MRNKQEDVLVFRSLYQRCPQHQILSQIERSPRLLGQDLRSLGLSFLFGPDAQVVL